MSQRTSSTNKNILVDTGFWFSFYTVDDNHEEAVKMAEEIWKTRILMPWPTLYEVLNTKFVKNDAVVKRFDSHLKTLSVEYIDDEPYKSAALRRTLEKSAAGKWDLSLVDSVIRNILADENKKIDALVTFNVGDFRDICHTRRIPIYFNSQSIM